MEESSNSSAEAVIETLRTRGWCFGDIQQLRALIVIHSALADDRETSTVVDSLEPDLLNMDLRSIGGKSLPDSVRKLSHIQGPKVLQISSARDISRSSIEDFSGNSSSERLLRLTLTDGHSEVTAIEYTHIPAISNDVVPGTKVRLENKVAVHSGILCLNPKVITILGGVIQSLYEEWEMSRKYSVFSRSSVRPPQESDGGGPPPFEKLQIRATSHRFAQRGRLHQDDSPWTLKTNEPIAVEAVGIAEVPLKSSQLSSDLRTSNSINSLQGTSLDERTEEKPSSSQARPKEAVESFPAQNQAASQKLLQKMSNPNQDNHYSRGRKNRGKGRQEESKVFTLDEWEKSKGAVKLSIKNELPDTSNDEDLAWKLQNQLDLEESHATVQRGMHDSAAENIKMSMFNYEKDDDRIHGLENTGSGRGRGRGRGRHN